MSLPSHTRISAAGGAPRTESPAPTRVADALSEDYSRLCERLEAFSASLDALANRLGAQLPPRTDDGKKAKVSAVPHGFVGTMGQCHGRLSDRVAAIQQTLDAISALV